MMVRRLPEIGFPVCERCASEKRAWANGRQGLQPGVPSRTGPGQPNEICVLPVRRPLAVTAGLATATAAPTHTTAALPIVTSLRKSWPPIRPVHATGRLTLLRRRRAGKDCVYQEQGSSNPAVQAALHRIGGGSQHARERARRSAFAGG